MFHRSVFHFQPGVCHSTVLCIVPSEEVSEMLKLDPEIKVTATATALSLVEYMQFA